MLVGDERTVPVSFGDAVPKMMRGTVVYIHPARRFYVVEITAAKGRKFTETYYFPRRGGRTVPAATGRKDK